MKPELAHELLARTEVNPEVTEKKKIKRMIFKNAGNCFNPQYTKTLRHHHGCVNAISVSKNGQYLLSGGDDCNVLMWQLLDSTDKCWSPVAVHRGHLSNIFSAAFSCTQRHIFSTGNDGLLLKYDVNRGASLVAASTASDVFVAHEEACFKVSTHPDNEALALTAGQDYKVRLWDMRTRSSPAHLERRGRRHNSVEFNPMFPNNFICSDDNGSILLYDLRKCFYSNDSTAHAPLMKYTTSMCRSNFVSRPADITSAVWHPEGRLIGAVTHNSTPTIYEMSNPHPLCILQCAESQGQHYQSVITIKTGAFSTSLGDDYFLSGSEDKHAYGWKLPSIDEMRENQRVNNWVNSTSIGFKSDGKKIIPMKVPKATIALGGHRSIVNSIACHPELPYIITAGVEKVVRLHSPIPLQSRDHDCDKLTHGIDQGHGRAYFEDDLEEDSDVITYFDRLVASHSVPNGPTWIVCPSRANYSDTENTSDGD